MKKYYGSSEVDASPRSPIRGDELRKLPIKDAVRKLVNFKGDDFRGPNRDGLLMVFSNSVLKSPAWGLKIAKELGKRKRPNSDLWKTLYWRFANAELTKDDWLVLFKFLSNEGRIKNYFPEVARILRGFVEKEESVISPDAIQLALGISDKLWRNAAPDWKLGLERTNDWQYVAINDPGGHLADFLVFMISLEWKISKDNWAGIPPNLKSQLRIILDGEYQAAAMGKVIIASQIGFLFSSDPSWCVRYVIPLLSWDKDELRAKQCWHGYLSWGMWKDELLESLFPLYESSFSRLDIELVDKRVSFVNHVASITMFSSWQQVRPSWLKQFIEHVDESDRENFAEAIRSNLKGKKDSKFAENSWKKWLQEYWSERNIGKHAPFNDKEIGTMVGWLPYLGTAFPEAVLLVLDYQGNPKVNSFLYLEILKSEIHNSFPTEVAKLFEFIVPASFDNLHDEDSFKKILNKIIQHKECHHHLKPLLEFLASQGVPYARDYFDKLE